MLYTPTSKNQLIKYSLNLYGIYENNHTKFEVKDKTLHSDWQVGTDGVMPENKSVVEKPRYGNLFFDYNAIRALSVKYEDLSGKQKEVRTITSIINHKPSRCNFWHYEIWWSNDMGSMIEDFSNSPQRSALSAIKTYLLNIASEAPAVEPQVIQQRLYES